MHHVFPHSGIVFTNEIQTLLPPNSTPIPGTYIISCTRGRMQITANKTDVLDMGVFDLLICMPEFSLGDYLCSPDFQCVCYFVPIGALSQVLNSCLQQETNWYNKLQYTFNHPIIHMNNRHIQLGSAFNRLMQVLIQDDVNNETQSKVSNILLQSIILEIFSWIHDEINKDENVMLNKISTARQDNHFRGFVRLLYNDHGRHRDVKWFAEQLHITPKYLAVICKKNSSQSPLALINGITIREIKEMLVHEALSVKELAEKFNFPNASMFCKYFKLHTGYTPLEYRETSRADIEQKKTKILEEKK